MIVTKARRDVRVTTCLPHPEDRLPELNKSDLAWLIAESITNVHAHERGPEDALPIGTSIVVRPGEARPDVLCLAHRGRLLLVQLYTPPTSTDHRQGHTSDPLTGLTLLSELLLCTSGHDAHPLRQSPHADVAIVLSSLQAYEISYLMHKWLRMHVCVQDLALFAEQMGCPSKSPFHCSSIAAAILSKEEMTTMKEFDSSCFRVHRGTTQLLSDFLDEIMNPTRNAVAAYHAADFLEQEWMAASGAETDRQGSILDTRNVPNDLLDYMATFTSVEAFLYAEKPVMSNTHLRRRDENDGVGDEKGKDTSVPLYAKVCDRLTCTFEVVNEHFRSRLMYNEGLQQEVSINVSGQIRTYQAETVDSKGKKSILRFVGDDAREAIDLLLLSNQEDDDNGAEEGLSRKKVDNDSSTLSFLHSIISSGQETYTSVETMAMLWRRKLLLPTNKGLCAESLLHALLFGEANRTTNALLDTETVELMEKSWQDSFSCVREKEDEGRLNPSQASAARAILSPLVIDPPPSSSDDESEEVLLPRAVADRLILVHGPPGTGKTSLITACCQQYERCFAAKGEEHVSSSLSNFAPCDTIYACCQSNVAVKNIGESLSKGGVNFKIIVSPNFYVEWHEDLYDDIKGRLIQSDVLPRSLSEMQRLMGGCRVILSTLSFLSGKSFLHLLPLRKLHPMRLLMVDEASQIHLRSYPHVLDLVSHSLARIIFLGDDKQLAPFNSEGSIEAGLSVFELEHLRERAFLLDTCYRLPKPMVAFISDSIYEGKVRVGQRNFDPPSGLIGCVSFVDVASGKETREGTSRTNEREADVVLALVQRYKEEGGEMDELKVLTTYDAQREVLESALQKANLGGSADMVFSVDSFQGRESDHIILSLVRDGRKLVSPKRYRQGVRTIVEPSLGFLKNERRTNVALTRARRSVTIVSNRRFINEVAHDTLCGNLQITLQFCQPDGEDAHWLEEDSVVKDGVLPHYLYAVQAA